MKASTTAAAAAIVAVVALAGQHGAQACDHSAVQRASAINADPVQRAAIHRRHFRAIESGKRQASKYPPPGATPPRSMTPKEWLDALATAERAGKIPNVPQTRIANGLIAYPSGYDVNQACSWTQTNCFGKNDISKAPDGYWGLNFDDGPNTPSPTLYRFLQQNNKAATFFLIGGNIAQNPDAIKQAQSMGVGNWGVHTWSHTVQTSLSNEDIVAELGWTMQIIYDLTGRIPHFWRPPQGDADNRVRAIAEEVFGMYAVMWDEECNDWCITADGNIATECANTTPGRSISSVHKAIDDATKLPKSPGVILLEHDLTTYSIKAFEDHTWTGIQANGWNAQPIGNFPGQTWYANSANASSPVSSQTSMLKSAQVAVSGSGSGSGNSGSGSSSSSRPSSSASSTSSSRPSSSSAGSGTPGAGALGASVPAILTSSVGALFAVALGAAALI